MNLSLESPAPTRGAFLMQLDLEAAARLLDVRPDTLARWVRQGLLSPSMAGGGRFERAELERWARQRGLLLAGEGKRPWKPGHDLFAEAIERGALTRGDVCESASAAIEQAIAALPDLPQAAREELLVEVLERERMASTALGLGVAVPHPRKPPRELLSQPVVSVLFPAQPLDWAALDGERVHTVLLLLSPSAPVHLEILARVAFALRAPGVAELLRSAPDKDELVARLRSIQRET